ncbi:MAG: hypothetical protein ACJA1H_000131 [Glaciecola sp.]|jgi:hypothetical protein
MSSQHRLSTAVNSFVNSFRNQRFKCKVYVNYILINCDKSYIKVKYNKVIAAINTL